MKKEDALVKSKYIGVYKKVKGFKPWITYIRCGALSFSLHSESEDKAALKYNILTTLYEFDR
ncbi:MAG: hypothetical protein APF77_22945 [Clostridia bacterium BRH_c25]|nr:MAG: hypothetical protein APF77_22945 [Clostridia bacterium BRH_c25]